MEVSLNIEHYLDREDIRKALLDALAYRFAALIRSEADVERVLANLSAEYVFTELCKHLAISREELERRIIDGVDRAMDPDHIKFQVFRRADAWDRSESPAVKILDDVLKDCRPVIEREVEKRIAEYSFPELEKEIEDTIYYTICRKLREPEGGGE